jgi:hypothetical protein
VRGFIIVNEDGSRSAPDLLGHTATGAQQRSPHSPGERPTRTAFLLTPRSAIFRWENRRLMSSSVAGSRVYAGISSKTMCRWFDSALWANTGIALPRCALAAVARHARLSRPSLSLCLT